MFYAKMINSLPELANPVSSDETASPKDEIAGVGKVQELDVLLHLQDKVLIKQRAWHQRQARGHT